MPGAARPTRSLRARLAAAETTAASLPPARCPTCRDWPDIVRYYEVREDGIERPCDGLPDRPDACPDCGWRPAIVTIQFEDWSQQPGAIVHDSQ